MSSLDQFDCYIKATRMLDESRRQREEWDRKIAAADAEMALVQFTVQQQAERIGHAMLYLGFNPNPTPRAFAAILGVEPPASSA